MKRRNFPRRREARRAQAVRTERSAAQQLRLIEGRRGVSAREGARLLAELDAGEDT